MPASLTGWTVSNVSVQVVNVAVPVAGFVLASRRPENRIGWLFLVAGLGLGVGGFSKQYALHALVAAPGSWPAGRAVRLAVQLDLGGPGRHARVFAPALPDGARTLPAVAPAAWFVGGALALATVWLLIAASQLWAHPFTSSSQADRSDRVAVLVTGFLISAALLVSVAALVVRFAKSSGEERLQLKWCAAAALVLVVVFVASIWVNSAAVNVLQSLAFLCLWTAIAIAVLKYRLYDIDRIISRTLAYAIVTGLLIGVYAGLVLLATQVLAVQRRLRWPPPRWWQRRCSARCDRRVQRAVDRRFNRARYDADQTVAAFAARLKDAVDLDAVRADLASVVQGALEPAHVSIWVSRRN